MYSTANQLCRYMHPVLLGFLPIEVTAEHQAALRVFQEASVSYLFVRNSVYVSIPVSQLIPLSPLPSWYPYTCSLCLCLYLCFVSRFIYTILLDFTYMHWYMIFVFLFLIYFTLTVSRSIYISANGTILFRFMAEIIFHCIYVPHLLYAFLCWWTFRLLPCPGCCK